MSYMKVPCKHCPFRIDVTPFLHPDRAAEIAYSTQNPYSSFACHKTTVEDEDSEDSETMVTEDSKECAGFLTLRAQDDDSGLPEGFQPSWELCYADPYAMSDAYDQEWNKHRTAH